MINQPYSFLEKFLKLSTFVKNAKNFSMTPCCKICLPSFVKFVLFSIVMDAVSESLKRSILKTYIFKEALSTPPIFYHCAVSMTHPNSGKINFLTSPNPTIYFLIYDICGAFNFIVSKKYKYTSLFII